MVTESIVQWPEGQTGDNVGTAASTDVTEYGNGRDHETLLTFTTFSTADVGDNASLGTGILVYTFPAGYIVVDWTYLRLVVAPAGAENDAIVADLGVGTTIASGAVSLLDGTPAFEDFLTGFAVTTDDSTEAISAKTPTVGTPMYIATGDDHTVNINFAAAWASSSAQTCTITGALILKWNFLE